MIKKFTLEYALAYTQYSHECPHYIDPLRWRAMLCFIAKNYGVIKNRNQSSIGANNLNKGQKDVR